MITLSTALVAALVAHATPASAPAPGAVSAPAQRDYDQPPAGLVEDQRLWRDLRAVTNDAVTHLGRIAQCAFRIDYGGYYQRLDLAAADEARRADAAARRQALEAAAAAADASRLPPPRDPAIRECRGVLVDLDTMMPLHADRKVAPKLARARKEARRCVQVIGPFAQRAEARATALEAALAEVDRFAPGPPPAAAAATPAAAPSPEASPAAVPAGGPDAPKAPAAKP